MDKNVGSVNLDELKAAREALNRDLGIENDPNMYNDYDPEKHKAEREQEKLARAQALDEMTGGVSADENNDSSEIHTEPAPVEKTFDDEEILEAGNQDIGLTQDTFVSSNAEEISSEPETLSDDEIISRDDEVISDSGISEPVATAEESAAKDASEIGVQVPSNESISLENDYARSPEVEAKTQEDDELPNFDVYDNFADFEINSGESVSQVETNSQEYASVESEEIVQPSETVAEQSQNDEEDDEGEESLDDFLSELDTILQKEEDDDEIMDSKENDSLDVELETLKSDENEEKQETALEEIESEPETVSLNVDALVENDEEEVKSNEVQQQEEVSAQEPEENVLKVEDVIKTQPVEDVVAVPIFDDDDPFSRLEKFEIAEAKNEEVSENKEFEVNVLDNFKALSELNAEDEIVETTDVVENEASEEIQENTEEKQTEETAELEVGGYAQIENFNFVDVISSEEFKKTDKMSYVLGKDSDGEVVFGNLRDTCGTAVFTRDEDVIYDGFSSILLSLLLKNTPDEIQFVVCDAMFDSEFDVFNNSSYMYFNRVAKNNREIVDSLLELSKELEKRYNNLVYAGVKSISAYNLQAEERGAQKMPYVVLFLNNYAKMTQFLDADRINTCLYNILKFGRIVGVYAMVASTSEIERNDINYNLPTRICYKTDDEHDSIAALGREGAEKLKDERDFLYSTVYDEELRHLKVPNLTRKEIELIIENLEK